MLTVNTILKHCPFLIQKHEQFFVLHLKLSKNRLLATKKKKDSQYTEKHKFSTAHIKQNR